MNRWLSGLLWDSAVKAIGAALLVLMSGSGCVRTSMGLVSKTCAHPKEATLETDQEAILAARRIWYCIKPDLEVQSEDHWLHEMRAEKRDDVWHVVQVLPEGYAGGGLVMDVAQSDGRLVDIVLTQ